MNPPSATSPPPPTRTEDGWLPFLLESVRRRFRLVLLWTLAGMSVAFAYAAHQPTLYRAEASIMLQPFSPVQRILDTSRLTWETTFIRAFYENMRSRAALAERLSSRKFLEEVLGDELSFQRFPSPNEGNRTKRNLTVRHSEDRFLFDLVYTSEDPGEPRRVLRKILASLSERGLQTYRRRLEITERTIRSLLRRMDPDPSTRRLLENRLETIQKAYFILDQSPNRKLLKPVSESGLESVEPPTTYYVLLGGSGGLILGILCALGFRTANPKLRKPGDVRKRLDRRPLGALPALEVRPERSVPLANDREEDRFHRSLEIVRTRLEGPELREHTDHLLVSSPTPGEGKTTLALNLSRLLAARGANTLLVDGNRRDGKLHRILELERDPGLFSPSDGTSRFETRTRNVDSLNVLTAGTPPTRGPDTLSRDRFRRSLHEFFDGYDRVVVDAPPVLGFADVLEFSSLMDGIVLVVRAGKTDVRAVREALDLLENASVRTLGIVLNAVPPGDLPGGD